MAVEICHDAWRQVAVMYCNTSDTAFGPIFTGRNAGTEAEDFLDWLRENGPVAGIKPLQIGAGPRNGTDPRDYPEYELGQLIHLWRAQYEPVVPEPQSLRVDDVEGHRVET